MSDVERIAQTYSHTLRSDLIAELNRLRAKERSMLAALARRDAAIQAVRNLRDSCIPRSPARILYNRALTAIAAELEKP